MPPYSAAARTDGHDLVGGRVGRRGVDQGCRHPHRALPHGRAHDLLHTARARRRSGARAELTEDGHPGLRLREVGAEVDRDASTPPDRGSTRSIPSTGTGVPPSPPIAVVTPMRSLFSARPLNGSTPPDWSIMSMKPGETYSPVASISRRPSALHLGRSERCGRISTATSARTHGFPAPSRTRPPRMTISYAGGS